jgi:hypothetical protein
MLGVQRGLTHARTVRRADQEYKLLFPDKPYHLTSAADGHRWDHPPGWLGAAAKMLALDRFHLDQLTGQAR